MVSSYLVCYDIADPKRLVRIYRYMRGCGIHMQYSVFFCRLSYPQLEQLKKDLKGYIKEDEDDVRIYPLPESSLIKVIGLGSRVPEGVEPYL